jgi:hypothetical protein
MSLRLVPPLPAGTPGDPGLTGADAGLVNDNRAGAPDPGR